MTRLGLAENEYIHPIVAGIGLVLTAIGIYGLYRCLPPTASKINVATFGVALLGVLMGLVGLLGFFVPLPESLIGAALILPWIGLVGMGSVAISTRALGALSFAPLAVVVAGVGFAVTVDQGTVQNPATLTQLFLLLHHVCWLLVGIAIWTSSEDVPNQALPA
jgi:hypothetical protein